MSTPITRKVTHSSHQGHPFLPRSTPTKHSVERMNVERKDVIVPLSTTSEGALKDGTSDSIGKPLGDTVALHCQWRHWRHGHSPLPTRISHDRTGARKSADQKAVVNTATSSQVALRSRGHSFFVYTKEIHKQKTIFNTAVILSPSEW